MFTSGELRDLAKSIRGEVSEVATVVQGVVSRVDPAGTVWVLIGDNADPTPCAMDMACRPGDVVTVRIANHKATVIGNETAPATDDKKANVAYNYAGVAQQTATEAQDTAKVAQDTANQAKKVAANAATKADVAEIAAQEAARVASAVNQHFWDDERGAHVTEEAKDDYLVEPSGFQNLMTSIGNIFTRAVSGVEKILRSDTASGMVVYDGECAPDAADLESHAVAAFTSDGVQIGRADNSHVEMDSSSFRMVDKDGNEFASFDDLRDESGITTITETFVGDGSTRTFWVHLSVADVVSVTDSSHASTSYTRDERDFTLTPAPSDGATVTIVYETADPEAKAYTIGLRRASSTVGVLSVAEGYDVTASSITSHAEGYQTTASGDYSHAEGGVTTASGNGSHAEGNSTIASGTDSHAEGYDTTASGNSSHAEGSFTTASGNSSHAEGYDTTASGFATHAEGVGTAASSDHQHVQGKYNVADANGTYAHIVGNGTGDSNRSNAHTVDWNGNGWYAGNVSADGALSCADGSPYCSDGTNVVVGGTTVGSADNLSYVLNGAQFITRRFTSSRYTIGANSTHISTITCPTVSGYTPLAVIGFLNNHGSSMTPVAVFMDTNANTVSFGNKNWSSTTFTDAFDVVTVLYAKTGLVDRDENW